MGEREALSLRGEREVLVLIGVWPAIGKQGESRKDHGPTDLAAAPQNPLACGRALIADCCRLPPSLSRNGFGTFSLIPSPETDG